MLTSLPGKALLLADTELAGVVRVAEVGPGEGIGYGHTFRTARPTRVATLRCGYADGYPRALSNRGLALIEGRRAPVIGRVCMDHVMVDVTDLADTISYELVARVGRRVERVFFEEEDPEPTPEEVE